VRQRDFAGVSETDDWVSGKKRSKDPDFKPNPPETATIIIGREVAMKFFGALDESELRRHLKELRKAGLLIHEPDRLTSQIRVRAAGQPGGIGHVHGYVIRGRKRDVPTISRETRRETRKRRVEPEQGRFLGSGR
jgi:hypothetical protein